MRGPWAFGGPGIGFPWLPGCGGCLASWLRLGLGVPGFGCLAYPVKIRVSTYGFLGPGRGIYMAEMKNTHTQEEIAYNRALAVFEKMVWAEKGSALRASLEARFATLHAEWLATVKKGGSL